MQITVLAENTSKRSMPTEHGLSLHILTDDGKTLLFDMGQSKLFATNAQRLGIDLDDVDFAIISHGHYDHGGGLSVFFEYNHHAKVYVHNQAFLPHYSLRDTGLRYIGLDETLKDSEQIVMCGDVTTIGNDMMLFAGVSGNCCAPTGNRLLFGPEKDVNDNFAHEQNLIVEEGDKTILLAGCAHRGIVNIIGRCISLTGKTPTHVIGGMHLVKSGLSDSEENEFINQLATELKGFGGCKFYTMHCTGEDQFRKLKALLGEQIEYLSCGEQVNI